MSHTQNRVSQGVKQSNNIVMDKKIKIFESQFEALKIKDILDSHNIPHMIRSFHDSAYDGLFQTQMGWGALVADEELEEEILKLIG